MKVCFLSLDSYPVLTKKEWGFAGGAEVEQVDLGYELVRRGHEVFFVTYRHGCEAVEDAHGIRILKTYSTEKAMVLTSYQKFKSVWSCLREANADIYFHESGATGILPLFCFLNNKKFVYRIPSNAMVLGKNLSGNSGFKQKIADLIDIKQANAIIAQNYFQKRILSERFKVKSIVIKNGVKIPPPCPAKNGPPIILWAGRITWVKRPHLFVELAKEIPYASFEIIGGKTDCELDLFNKIKAEAQELPNIKFQGFIPYHLVNEYFRRATLLVNTSVTEAFPITFIQAWANGAPVVSLNVDPDNVIQNEKLGFYSRSKKQLLIDVKLLLKDENLRREMGTNARNYIKREHDVQKVAEEYVKIFENTLEV
jgi:glycosyltransferase involved in cell wall biosynthesis